MYSWLCAARDGIDKEGHKIIPYSTTIWTGSYVSRAEMLRMFQRMSPSKQRRTNCLFCETLHLYSKVPYVEVERQAESLSEKSFKKRSKLENGSLGSICFGFCSLNAKIKVVRKRKLKPAFTTACIVRIKVSYSLASYCPMADPQTSISFVITV